MILATIPFARLLGLEVSRDEQSAPGLAFSALARIGATAGRAGGIVGVAGLGNHAACFAHALDWPRE